MHRKSKLILVLPLIPLLCACNADKPKKKLTDALYEHYETDCSFLISAGEGSIEGTAHIQKTDELSAAILSPEPYAGIRIHCGNGGENAAYSIEYDGVGMEMPKETLGNLSLLLTFYEEPFANAIEALPSKAFTATEGTYTTDGIEEPKPYAASFENGGIDYSVVCDGITGTPLYMTAKADGIVICVTTDSRQTIDTTN